MTKGDEIELHDEEIEVILDDVLERYGYDYLDKNLSVQPYRRTSPMIEVKSNKKINLF